MAACDECGNNKKTCAVCANDNLGAALADYRRVQIRLAKIIEAASWLAPFSKGFELDRIVPRSYLVALDAAIRGDAK